MSEGMGLDISNYQPAVPPVACWRAAGVEWCIVGSQRPDIARQQIPVLRAGGVTVPGVYSYLYLGYDVAAETAKGIALAQEFGVRRVWLDVERNGERAGVTVAERIAQVRACVAQVEAAGLATGIYTGPAFWREAMGDTTEFARLPLWMADYRWSGKWFREASFGGWATAAIHQYTTTGTRNDSVAGGVSPALCGVSVDYNYCWEDIQEDGMTQEQEARLARLEAIVAGNGALAQDGTTVLTGEEALKDQLARGNSLALGLAFTQKALAEAGPAPTDTAVPDHKHALQIAVSSTGPVV